MQACTRFRGETSGSNSFSSCFRCGEEGHFARECINSTPVCVEISCILICSGMSFESCLSIFGMSIYYANWDLVLTFFDSVLEDSYYTYYIHLLSLFRHRNEIMNFQLPRKDPPRKRDWNLKLDPLLMKLAPSCVKEEKPNMKVKLLQILNKNQDMVGWHHILETLSVVDLKPLLWDHLQLLVAREPIRGLLLIHQLPARLESLIGLTIIIILQMAQPILSTGI